MHWNAWINLFCTLIYIVCVPMLLWFEVMRYRVTSEKQRKSISISQFWWALLVVVALTIQLAESFRGDNPLAEWSGAFVLASVFVLVMWVIVHTLIKMANRIFGIKNY